MDAQYSIYTPVPSSVSRAQSVGYSSGEEEEASDMWDMDNEDPTKKDRDSLRETAQRLRNTSEAVFGASNSPTTTEITNTLSRWALQMDSDLDDNRSDSDMYDPESDEGEEKDDNRTDSSLTHDMSMCSTQSPVAPMHAVTGRQYQPSPPAPIIRLTIQAKETHGAIQYRDDQIQTLLDCLSVPTDSPDLLEMYREYDHYNDLTDTSGTPSINEGTKVLDAQRRVLLCAGFELQGFDPQTRPPLSLLSILLLTHEDPSIRAERITQCTRINQRVVHALYTESPSQVNCQLYLVNMMKHLISSMGDVQCARVGRYDVSDVMRHFATHVHAIVYNDPSLRGLLNEARVVLQQLVDVMDGIEPTEDTVIYTGSSYRLQFQTFCAMHDRVNLLIDEAIKRGLIDRGYQPYAMLQDEMTIYRYAYTLAGLLIDDQYRTTARIFKSRQRLNVLIQFLFDVSNITSVDTLSKECTVQQAIIGIIISKHPLQPHETAIYESLANIRNTQSARLQAPTHNEEFEHWCTCRLLYMIAYTQRQFVNTVLARITNGLCQPQHSHTISMQDIIQTQATTAETRPMSPLTLNAAHLSHT